MNEKSYYVVERALYDLLKKTKRKRDYFRGRLIKAEDLPLPKQHMVMAAYNNVDRLNIDIYEIEGELEMLREEFESDSTEENEEGEPVGEEKNQEYDSC